ncbi:hypothetical protein RB200_38110 [Streptomyces sp. PmtG]
MAAVAAAYAHQGPGRAGRSAARTSSSVASAAPAATRAYDLALLRVLPGERRHRVQEPRPQADARAGEARPERRDEPGGGRGGEHGRQPYGDLARAGREQGVHEQVVEAVHGVHGAQQPPDLGQGAARHLERDALVAPDGAALDAPEADGEHDEGREEREGGGCGHPGDAPLDLHG